MRLHRCVRIFFKMESFLQAEMVSPRCYERLKRYRLNGYRGSEKSSIDDRQVMRMSKIQK